MAGKYGIGAYGIGGNTLSITKDSKLKVYFFIGILAGTLFFNWWGRQYIKDMVIYKSAVETQYLAVELQYASLCIHIFKERLKQLGFVLLCCITTWKKAGAFLCHMYYGIAFGYILSAFVLQYKLMGIIICFLWLMPHYLCYAVLWYLIFGAGASMKKYYRILGVIIFFLLGVVLEGYVNTTLLQKFIQRF